MSACVLSVIFEFFVPILVCVGADGWNTCRASRWGACMSAEIIREGGMGGAFFCQWKELTRDGCCLVNTVASSPCVDYFLS